MFAVKGWSLDASTLKPQTEIFKSAKALAKEAKKKSTGTNSTVVATPAAADGESKAVRKRKRRNEGPDADQEHDVGKLWEKHIERKKESTRSREKKREMKKKRKLETGSDADVDKDVKDVQAGTEVVVVSDRADEERNAKESKKDKKGKDKSAAESSTASLPEQQTAAPTSPAPAPIPVPAGAKLTPMQTAMRQKLISARFRHLNQILYTAPSPTALGLFDQNPEMFEDYHAGFRRQVEVWPENPVDNFIATLRQRGRVKQFPGKTKAKRDVSKASKPSDVEALPRTHGTCIIADLGCGDARLATTLTSTTETSTLQLKIHSYDLASASPLIIKADISNLPTDSGSIDIAIFCLALMGTNWIAFVEEAYRILHWKGELWVAEIRSRFGRPEKRGSKGLHGRVVDHSVGSKKKTAALLKEKAKREKEGEEVDEQSALRMEVDGVEAKPQVETDASAFVEVLRRRGFVLKNGDQSIDLSNRMFVKMEFVKAAAPTKGRNFVPDERAVAAKRDGTEGEVKRFAKPKKRFIEEGKEEDIATDDEAKVLKPCLYKNR